MKSIIFKWIINLNKLLFHSLFNSIHLLFVTVITYWLFHSCYTLEIINLIIIEILLTNSRVKSMMKKWFKPMNSLITSCDRTTAAILFLLKLIAWDRWNVSIPLSDNWNMMKQIDHLTARGHQWQPAFQKIAYANYHQHLPVELRCQLEAAILSPLAQRSDPAWSRALELLLDKWSSLDSSACDYQDVCSLVLQDENQQRRQLQFSEEIASYLRQIFSDVIQ